MKQTIEIEVPEGKKAIWEDGQIKFVPTESWKDITTFEGRRIFKKFSFYSASF